MVLLLQLHHLEDLQDCNRDPGIALRPLCFDDIVALDALAFAVIAMAQRLSHLSDDDPPVPTSWPS